MGLGNLLKALVKTAVLPADIIKDVATMGLKKPVQGTFFTEDQINDIADELNKITKNGD